MSKSREKGHSTRCPLIHSLGPLVTPEIKNKGQAVCVLHMVSRHAWFPQTAALGECACKVKGKVCEATAQVEENFVFSSAALNAFSCDTLFNRYRWIVRLHGRRREADIKNAQTSCCLLRIEGLRITQSLQQTAKAYADMVGVCQKHTAYMNVPYHVGIYCCLVLKWFEKSCEVFYTQNKSVNKRLKQYVRKRSPWHARRPLTWAKIRFLFSIPRERSVFTAFFLFYRKERGGHKGWPQPPEGGLRPTCCMNLLRSLHFLLWKVWVYGQPSAVNRAAQNSLRSLHSLQWKI